MKRLSIKLRVTLWFTLSMLLLLILVSGFLLFTEKKLKNVTMQKELMETVDRVEDMNRYEIGTSLSDPVDDVYISLYNTGETLMAGIIPPGFKPPSAFREDTTYRVKSGNQEWLVYDAKCKQERGYFLWVRGILVLQDRTDNNRFLHILLVSLPFMVIVIALAGYVVINRAFRPINEIIRTAEKIGEGADLSQRIQVGEGKDEISTLSKTFNHMFEKLEAYFENEKRFTADASHELRTPASVILAQCEYALEHAGSIEEGKEALIKIRQQAIKMSSLIANLLTLARMDNGQYPNWNLERINISELADVIIEQQKELAEQRNITITKDLEPDIFIRADETMIMRMFINLIENGIHYGKENGLLNISLVKQETYMECRIMDNGIGIAPEHIEKIWDRFYQADPARNHIRSNSGLGLAMVKWIVKAHKGKIWVQSEIGKGSVFTIILPCEET